MSLSRCPMFAQDPGSIALGATDANAIALPGPPGTQPPSVRFTPAAGFGGARPGMVFKSGAQGTGYYPDTGLLGSSSHLPPGTGITGDTLARDCTPLHLILPVLRTCRGSKCIAVHGLLNMWARHVVEG